SRYTSRQWEPDQFAQRMGRAREQVALMRQPARSLTPGNYRVYLALRAVGEILSILGWGGFSGRGLATKKSPMLPLFDGRLSLDPRFTLTEDYSLGLVPRFDHFGFVR